MDFNFTPEEIRVLGCLIEKQTTTPEQYPMSLNYTKTACNQKSSREPVVEYTEETVQMAFDKLKARGIALYRSEHGSRVSKFEHLFSAVFKLGEKESAALCLLMLRGPQTPGEIKTRCSRLASFSDGSEVENVLNQLASSEKPLVKQLPKQPGRKECRFIHLLSGEPNLSETPTSSDPVIEIVQVDTTETIEALKEKVLHLEEELNLLKEDFLSFKKQFEA